MSINPNQLQAKFQETHNQISNNEKNISINESLSVSQIKELSEKLRKNKAIKALRLNYFNSIPWTREEIRPNSMAGVGEYLRAVEDLPSLQQLEIYKQDLAAKDFVSLGKIIQKSSHLTVLRFNNVILDQNSINNLAEGIRATTTLRSLHLYGVWMPENVEAFSEAIATNRSLKELDIFCIGLPTGMAEQIFYGALPRNKSLERVHLKHDETAMSIHPDAQNEFSDALKTNTNLKDLSLSYGIFGDWHSGDSDDDDDAYEEFNSTQPKLFEGLRTSRIKKLSMLEPLDKLGLAVLESVLPQNDCLETLIINNAGDIEKKNKLPADENVHRITAALKENKSLTSLGVRLGYSENFLTERGLNYLLDNLYLEGSGNALQSLSLRSGTSFNYEATEAMLVFLQKPKVKLRHLSMSVNSNSNLILLATALQSNTSLTSLSIDVYWEDKKFDRDYLPGTKALAESIKINKSLTALKLTWDENLAVWEENDNGEIERFNHFDGAIDLKGPIENSRHSLRRSRFLPITRHFNTPVFKQCIIRNILLKRNWATISFALSFFRASIKHPFVWSFIPLVRTILEMAYPKTSSVCGSKVKQANLNGNLKINLFMNSKFIQNYLTKFKSDADIKEREELRKETRNHVHHGIARYNSSLDRSRELVFTRSETAYSRLPADKAAFSSAQKEWESEALNRLGIEAELKDRFDVAQKYYQKAADAGNESGIKNLAFLPQVREFKGFSVSKAPAAAPASAAAIPTTAIAATAAAASAGYLPSSPASSSSSSAAIITPAAMVVEDTATKVSASGKKRKSSLF